MSNPPSWWNESIAKACLDAAIDAFPNEACGLISVGNESTCLHLLKARANPFLVYAFPESVVSLAYQMEREDRRVIATFHTHPTGHRDFSARDKMLDLWANQHVLAVWITGSWQFIHKTVG